MIDQPEQPMSAPVPTGKLLQLSVSEVRVNPGNPRRLFDPGPLADLKENIRTHGVLVPLTVYRLPGQAIYEILDGQRRFQCCQDLEKEGVPIRLPANIVEPPTKLAALLYMFNIHNYRQPWELMPTALSLQTVIRALGTDDTRQLSNLTGLNDKSVERCKLLLKIPPQYQSLSLDPDAEKRIPSNFWIEAYPVVDLVEEELPVVWAEFKQEGIFDRLVEKYRRKRLRSVIHFRRIVEAFEVANRARRAVLDTLAEYIRDVDLETRAAFDPFLAGSHRTQDAVKACRNFLVALGSYKIEHATDERDTLLASLKDVASYVSGLISSLEGGDQPESIPSDYLDDDEEADVPSTDAERPADDSSAK